MAVHAVNRFGMVRSFLRLLVSVVDFDATPEGEAALGELLSLPELMGRKKVGPAEIDTGLSTGSWPVPRATPCTCWTSSTTATAASARR